MKHARIILASPTTMSKASAKALEDANKYLNKLAAARKKEGRLTVIAMSNIIRLSLSKAKFVDDVSEISVCRVYSGAGLECFNAFIDKKHLIFNIAIDTL